jgi:hypothetical protein
MIVRFDAKVGSFIMMEDIAVPLLQMMGHSGTVPSAILAGEIPQALAQLKAALAKVPPPPPEPEPARDDEERRVEPAVSLRQRAYPLVDLLERSARKGCDVMWTVEPPGVN